MTRITGTTSTTKKNISMISNWYNKVILIICSCTNFEFYQVKRYFGCEIKKKT